MNNYVEKLINISGVDIEVLESCNSGPPVVLVHGNSSSARCFINLIKSSSDIKFISISLPGHGKSELINECISIQNIGNTISKVIKKLKLKKYILLGQSLGGHSLLENINSFTDAIGLILVSSPPISKTTISSAFLDDPSGGLLFKGKVSDRQALELANCFFMKHEKKLSEIMRIDIINTNTKFRPMLGESLLNGRLLDEIELLNSSVFPIMIIKSDHDEFICEKYYETLPMKNVWNNKIYTVKNSGHSIAQSCPGELLNHIKMYSDFINTNIINKL